MIHEYCTKACRCAHCDRIISMRKPHPTVDGKCYSSHCYVELFGETAIAMTMAPSNPAIDAVIEEHHRLDEEGIARALASGKIVEKDVEPIRALSAKGREAVRLRLVAQELRRKATMPPIDPVPSATQPFAIPTASGAALDSIAAMLGGPLRALDETCADCRERVRAAMLKPSPPRSYAAMAGRLRAAGYEEHNFEAWRNAQAQPGAQLMIGDGPAESPFLTHVAYAGCESFEVDAAGSAALTKATVDSWHAMGIVTLDEARVITRRGDMLVVACSCGARFDGVSPDDLRKARALAEKVAAERNAREGMAELFVHGAGNEPTFCATCGEPGHRPHCPGAKT